MIAGVLLCGGASRRFGADKLLAGEVPIAARARIETDDARIFVDLDTPQDLAGLVKDEKRG